MDHRPGGRGRDQWRGDRGRGWQGRGWQGRGWQGRRWQRQDERRSHSPPRRSQSPLRRHRRRSRSRSRSRSHRPRSRSSSRSPRRRAEGSLGASVPPSPDGELAAGALVPNAADAADADAPEMLAEDVPAVDAAEGDAAMEDGEGSRADIRTMCKAEIDQRFPSLEILLGHAFAILIDQGYRPANIAIGPCRAASDIIRYLCEYLPEWSLSD